MGLFLDCFSDLPDPRHGNARRHDLLELLTIALSATLCGAGIVTGTCSAPPDSSSDTPALCG